MSHRFTTWWRALSVVLLSLATVTWPSASWADTTPQFVIAHQSPMATLSARRGRPFRNHPRHYPGHGRSQRHRDHLSRHYRSRGEIAPIVDGTGPGVAARRHDGILRAHLSEGGRRLIQHHPLHHARCPVAAFLCAEYRPASNSPAPALGCGGVYPIRYVVSVNGTEITKWSLLAVQAAAVAKPLASVARDRP
jgi:hypothetical protein